MVGKPDSHTSGTQKGGLAARGRERDHRVVCPARAEEKQGKWTSYGDKVPVSCSKK